MKKPVVLLLASLIALACTPLHAQDVIYHKEDSIFIEKLLKKYHKPKDKPAILPIAEEFAAANTTYTGGTLDAHIGEPLFISCSRVDCTTFAELVLAIAFTAKEEVPSFETVCRNLEKIRYRSGERNGYASRLHYMSWWITDCAKQGIIEEVATRQHTGKQQLDLCFMSRNSSKYPQLAKNRELTETIAEYEKPFRGIKVKYIPKELLANPPQSLDIKDGDMLSLVTAIEGLDVTHVGFAVWKGEKLHLLHASSGKGKVINDTITLYDYMKSKKNHLGIRVFRATD